VLRQAAETGVAHHCSTQNTFNPAVKLHGETAAVPLLNLGVRPRFFVAVLEEVDLLRVSWFLQAVRRQWLRLTCKSALRGARTTATKVSRSGLMPTPLHGYVRPARRLRLQRQAFRGRGTDQAAARVF
jgi:hypothetical protein